MFVKATLFRRNPDGPNRVTKAHMETDTTCEVIKDLYAERSRLRQQSLDQWLNHIEGESFVCSYV